MLQEGRPLSEYKFATGDKVALMTNSSNVNVGPEFIRLSAGCPPPVRVASIGQRARWTAMNAWWMRRSFGGLDQVGLWSVDDMARHRLSG